MCFPLLGIPPILSGTIECYLALDVLEYIQLHMYQFGSKINLPSFDIKYPIPDHPLRCAYVVLKSNFSSLRKEVKIKIYSLTVSFDDSYLISIKNWQGVSDRLFRLKVRLSCHSK